MNIENYTLHLPGQGKKYLYSYLNKYKEKQITISDNITIITTATADVIDDCPLIYQLKKSNIPFINSACNYTGEWKKTTKLPLILSALSNVATPYSLIMDANDAVILKDIDKTFIDIWHKFDCDILFNGSQYLYPNTLPASGIENMENNILFVNHYLNAGVCFGYTDKLKELYATAYEFSQTKNYCPVDSEQYYIRIATIENNDVKCEIDCSSKLFLLSHGN